MAERKFANFVTMLTEELGDTVDNVTYNQFLSGVRFILMPYAEAVMARDIDVLSNLNLQFMSTNAIQLKEKLHLRLQTADEFTDKFWRYLEYFMVLSAEQSFSNM